MLPFGEKWSYGALIGLVVIAEVILKVVVLVSPRPAIAPRGCVEQGLSLLPGREAGCSLRDYAEFLMNLRCCVNRAQQVLGPALERG